MGQVDVTLAKPVTSSQGPNNWEERLQELLSQLQVGEEHKLTIEKLITDNQDVFPLNDLELRKRKQYNCI